MPRRGSISKRDVLPDPLYNSKLVTKLINNVMYDGKKGVAQTIVYDAFTMIEEKLGQNALEVFQAALDNTKTTSPQINTCIPMYICKIYLLQAAPHAVVEKKQIKKGKNDSPN